MYKVITGKLKARTAINIGSGQGNDVTDALVRRDALGRPFIPGTGIAGALRASLTRLAPRLGFKCCNALSQNDKKNDSCQCEVCHLFGDINPSDQPGSKSEASRLTVFDALADSADLETMIRDGVGIDRATGAAARSASAKFDLEVVIAGSRFDLRMELNDPTPEDEKLLAAGLDEWQAGRLWLGGRVARGLGAFSLSDLEFKNLSLDTPEELLNYLSCDEPWQEAVVQPNWLQENLASLNFLPSKGQPDAVLRNWFELSGLLQADGALLTNDVLSAGMTGFAQAPLLEKMGAWPKPALAGSGLRGVIRSHAERLARTLVTLQNRKKEDYLLHCPVCDPNARDGGGNLPSENCDSLLKESEKNGSLSKKNKDVTDLLCLACRLFGSPRRGSRLIVEDAPYVSTSPQKTPEYKMLDFLAIDRFTGGGADKLKFDAVALWRPAFSFKLYLENPEPWELGWLWLVFRDLAEGWLRVGFGGAKGFGCIKLVDWRAEFGYILPEDMPDLAKLGLAERKGNIYSVIEVSEAVQNYDSILQQWVDEFQKKIQSFSRPSQMQLKADSYFVGRLNELYPVIGGETQ